MDLGLQGRVALVTASSKGLGRATAEALAAIRPPHRAPAADARPDVAAALFAVP